MTSSCKNFASTSTHLIFGSNSSKGQILRAPFKLNETIVYPSNFLFAFHSFIPRVLSVSPLRVGFSRENRPFSSRNGVCSPASVAPFQTFQLFSVFHCTKNSKRSLRSEKVHRDHSATSFAYDHDRLPSLLSGR